MILWRTRKRFRYKGDPREVKLEMSIEEARKLSDGEEEMRKMLLDAIEDSEDLDSDLTAVSHPLLEGT